MPLSDAERLGHMRAAMAGRTQYEGRVERSDEFLIRLIDEARAERDGLLEQIAVMENGQLNDAADMALLIKERDAARAAHGRLREAAEEYLVHEIREPSGADICELCEVVAVSDDWAQPFPHAPDCPLAPLEEPK